MSLDSRALCRHDCRCRQVGVPLPQDDAARATTRLAAGLEPCGAVRRELQGAALARLVEQRARQQAQAHLGVAARLWEMWPRAPPKGEQPMRGEGKTTPCRAAKPPTTRLSPTCSRGQNTQVSQCLLRRGRLQPTPSHPTPKSPDSETRNSHPKIWRSSASGGPGSNPSRGEREKRRQDTRARLFATLHMWATRQLRRLSASLGKWTSTRSIAIQTSRPARTTTMHAKEKCMFLNFGAGTRRVGAHVSYK